MLGQVDTYATPSVANTTAYSVTGLSAGTHTLAIEATGNKEFRFWREHGSGSMRLKAARHDSDNDHHNNNTHDDNNDAHVYCGSGCDAVDPHRTEHPLGEIYGKVVLEQSLDP
jgi:hypothetical protein